MSDASAFKKAAETENASDKMEALRKFLSDFPDSSLRTDAQELLVAATAAVAGEKLQNGDHSGAAALFLQAIDGVPAAVSDKLFSEVLLKVPQALYWQGDRASGLLAAAKLASIADGSPARLLALADFYLGIESGTEARTLAEKAISLQPDTPAAYITLGNANRLDFRLEESSAAYAKALELDPASDGSRRALADMQRALGKPDAAAALYREILAKDPANVPAQTGLVLSLFDDGKMAEAETEMARSLESTPGNMILLAGAAYWYAVHGNPDKAIEVASRAVETEPRYIWSHIALARGYMARNEPVEAEKTLIKARQYGNFPTLEYELASARLMAGFYRDALEELRKHFTVKDGNVQTLLGGRVAAENKSLADLIAFERKASIFEPADGGGAERADRLKDLLVLDDALKGGNDEDVSRAADAFTDGTDAMKLHRQLYAASVLLEKKSDLPKVLDLTKAAIGTADSALDVPNAGAAVMASELYESRSIAFSRGDYLNVPDVPRQTLLSILRGRIEELTGWALFYQNNSAEAVTHLKRAVSVMPEKSTWWRSSMWRLGAALQAEGSETEALDAYVKSYKTDRPDIVKYSVVETLYKKLHGGSSDGLEALVGPDRVPAQLQSADTAQSTAEAPAAAAPTDIPVNAVVNTPKIPSTVPIKTVVDDSQKAGAVLKSEAAVENPPAPSATTTVDENAVGAAQAGAVEVPASPTPAAAEPIIEKSAEAAQPPASIPPAQTGSQEQKVDVAGTKTDEPAPANPDPAKAAELEKPPAAKTEVPEIDSSAPEKSTAAPPVESPKTEPRPEPSNTDTAERPADRTEAKPVNQAETSRTEKVSVNTPKSVFEPIIISVPKTNPISLSNNSEPQSAETGSQPDNSRPQPSNGLVRPRVVASKSIEPETAACSIVASRDNVSVLNGVGSVGILIAVEGQGELKAITAASSSPKDISVTLEPEIAGVEEKSFYLIQSVSSRTGVYQVAFELPCGRTEVLVKVH
jgi:tetratricopeptide (TPR) repeat protein